MLIRGRMAERVAFATVVVAALKKAARLVMVSAAIDAIFTDRRSHPRPQSN